MTDSLFWGPRSDEVEIESHYGLVFLHPSVCVRGGGVSRWKSRERHAPSSDCDVSLHLVRPCRRRGSFHALKSEKSNTTDNLIGFSSSCLTMY